MVNTTSPVKQSLAAVLNLNAGYDTAGFLAFKVV